MKRTKTVIKELIVFAMLGTIMFLSDLIMDALPNIHAIAMFIALFTLIYRWKALIPLYVYVALTGVYAGLAPWWIPYLYVWAPLWALMMLIPKNAPDKVKFILSTVFCSLHGITFGLLYTPGQAIMYGLNLQGMISWYLVGIPFDILSLVGNFAMSFLIKPLYKVLRKIA